MKFPFFKRKTPNDTFSETLARYQKALKDNPDDLRVKMKIAQLYLDHKKTDQAIAELIEAARGFQAKRQSQIAVGIYNKIVSAFPDQYDIYNDLADLHIKNGFIGDGVAVLEKLAGRYYENDMKFEATRVLKKISAIDPDNELIRKKVTRFYETRDISEEQALKEGPQDKWHLADEGKKQAPGRGDVSPDSYFDLEAALEDDMSISISAVSDDEAQDLEDVEQQSQMDPDAVLSQIKNSIESESDQDSPGFHYTVGLAYQRYKRLPDAIKEFEAAYDGFENKVECLLRMAECHAALKQYDSGQDCIQRALKLDDLKQQDMLELNYQSGLLYAATGKTKKALKVLRKVYEKDKNHKAVALEINKLLS